MRELTEWVGEKRKIRRERGASGLEGGARRFSLRWCLHLGRKGILLSRVETPPKTKSFVMSCVSTRD
jgi:hypothetical protein